jgi:hypothetical protein
MKAGWEVVGNLLHDHKDGDRTRVMLDVITVAEEVEKVMKDCKLAKSDLVSE